MSFLRVAAAAALLSVPGSLMAHDSYIQLRFGEWTFVNAHGAEEDDSYAADKLANIAAHDAAGAAAGVETVRHDNYTAFAPADDATSIAATYVSGFWTRDADGAWHNTTKDQVDNADSAGEYARHAVALIGHADTFQSFGLPLEIIPAADPLDMHPGDMLTITVLSDGQPLTGAEVGSALPGIDAVVTDENGQAQIVIQEGHNIVLTSHKLTHPEPEKADTLSHEATLSFVPHGDHDH